MLHDPANRYLFLTDAQLVESLDAVREAILDLNEEARSPKWFIQRKGYDNLVAIITGEQQRRLNLAGKLERLGSISYNSSDPRQLAIWTFL